MDLYRERSGWRGAMIASTTSSALPGQGALAMSTKEAARLLSVSHRTLEDWRLKGQGPRFRRWGRMVRYRLSDLNAFADGPSFSNTGEALAA